MAEIMHNGERVLRWESPQRYYAARVQKDLLGDVVVAMAWGGLHNNNGDSASVVVRDQAEAEATIDDLHKRRTAHRYQLVTDRRS